VTHLFPGIGSDSIRWMTGNDTKSSVFLIQLFPIDVTRYLQQSAGRRIPDPVSLPCGVAFSPV
jgi:hypothetical protein